MSNLVGEIMLRLSKALVTAILAAIVFVVVVAGLGASASVELALLCWLAAAAFVLLVQESPI